MQSTQVNCAHLLDFEFGNATKKACVLWRMAFAAHSKFPKTHDRTCRLFLAGLAFNNEHVLILNKEHVLTPNKVHVLALNKRHKWWNIAASLHVSVDLDRVVVK